MNLAQLLVRSARVYPDAPGHAAAVTGCCGTTASSPTRTARLAGHLRERWAWRRATASASS